MLFADHHCDNGPLLFLTLVGSCQKLKNWHLLLPWVIIHHLRPIAGLVGPLSV